MAKKKQTKLPTSKAKTAYELLSEVRRLILVEPLRYDQTTFVVRKDGAGNADLSSFSGNFPACGTVGCVAGWVVTLKHPRRPFSYTDTGFIAAEILGLDTLQEHELFGPVAVRGTPQTERHASNGTKHIARFQKKYAAQLKAKAV